MTGDDLSKTNTISLYYSNIRDMWILIFKRYLTATRSHKDSNKFLSRKILLSFSVPSYIFRDTSSASNSPLLHIGISQSIAQVVPEIGGFIITYSNKGPLNVNVNWYVPNMYLKKKFTAVDLKWQYQIIWMSNSAKQVFLIFHTN